MATEFSRIKQAAEDQKTKKMRAEAKISSLEEEQQRLFKELSEEIGKAMETIDDVKHEEGRLKEEIEENIEKMKKILDEEGVEY